MSVMSFNHADDPSGIMSCDDGLVDVGAKTIVSGVGESSAWTNPVSSSTSPSFDALNSFTIGDGDVNGNVHVGENGILDALGSWASELNASRDVYRDDEDVNGVCNAYFPTSPFPTFKSRAQSPIDFREDWMIEQVDGGKGPVSTCRQCHHRQESKIQEDYNPPRSQGRFQRRIRLERRDGDSLR